MRIITCDLNSVENGELIMGKIRTLGIPVFSIDISYETFDQTEHPLDYAKHLQIKATNSIFDTVIFSHVKLTICCPADSAKTIHQILVSQGATSIRTK